MAARCPPGRSWCRAHCRRSTPAWRGRPWGARRGSPRTDSHPGGHRTRLPSACRHRRRDGAPASSTSWPDGEDKSVGFCNSCMLCGIKQRLEAANKIPNTFASRVKRPRDTFAWQAVSLAHGAHGFSGCSPFQWVLWRPPSVAVGLLASTAPRLGTGKRVRGRGCVSTCVIESEKCNSAKETFHDRPADCDVVDHRWKDRMDLNKRREFLIETSHHSTCGCLFVSVCVWVCLWGPLPSVSTVKSNYNFGKIVNIAIC